MWFFGAYQPAKTTTKRHVDATTSGIATAITHDTTQKNEIQYLSGNVTNQFGNKLRTRGGVQQQLVQDHGPPGRHQWRRGGDHELHQRHEEPELVAVGHRGLHGEQQLRPQRARPVFRRRPGLQRQQPGPVPFCEARRTSARRACPPTCSTPRATRTSPRTTASRRTSRPGTSCRWTRRISHAAGAHQIKGGVQIDRRGNDVSTGTSRT